jgi:hypothetical protein
VKKHLKVIVFNLLTALIGAAGLVIAPEMVDQYAEAILTVGGLFLAVGNAFLIKWKAGKAETSVPPPTAVIALVLLAGLLGACSTFVETKRPTQTTYAIERDFNVAQTLILSFLKTEYATPEVKVYVKKLEAAAFNAVVAAQDAAKAGNDPKIRAAISVAEDAVAEILDYLMASGWLAQPPPAKPASYPSPRGFAQEPRIPLTVLEF